MADELHKTIIWKLKKCKVYSSFRDNIWEAGWADMPLIFEYNKEIRFLIRVIDIYFKYAWVVSLNVKKDIAITNVFQKNLDVTNRCIGKFKRCKPNKIWVDKGSEFYNKSMKL